MTATGSDGDDAAMDCALFDSPLGLCGLAWTGQGIRALQLPEATPALTVERLWLSANGETGGGSTSRLDQAGSAPTLQALLDRGLAGCPPLIEQAIAEVLGLLAGEHFDLRDLRLDERHVSFFERRVYQAAREIPIGQTVTYGELARRIGAPAAARAVGRALGRNPFVIIVPCHRILAAGGRPGGFSAHGGLVTKRRLLSIEAAITSEALPLFARAAS